MHGVENVKKKTVEDVHVAERYRKMRKMRKLFGTAQEFGDRKQRIVL